MSDELPQGWTTASLSDIADINPRHPRDLDDDLLVSFAPMPAISELRPDFRELYERPLSEVRKGFTHFAEGDVLFAKITPCMENGKAAVATRLSNGLGCGTTELHVLRPLGGVDPLYIYHFIHQPSFRRAAEANFTGSAGQLRVPVAFVENAEVPIPPLNEQRRIMAKLEKLLGKVDACQQRLAKIPVLLKRFRQSVLAAACSGRLSADWREENGNRATPASLLGEIGKRRKEIWAAQRKAKGLAAKPADYPEPANPSDEFEFDVPELWQRSSMDALTSVITSGSRDWKKYYRDDGSGTFIMAQNIRPLRFDRSYRLAVAPAENDRDRVRSEVFKEDLLVTIVGANTGDCCRVPEKLREHYVCQSVALIRPVLQETSQFLELFLNSPGHGLAEWRKWIYGEGRPHLSFDNLRETLVCLPPLAEQQEIVCRVEALFALADQLEARYAKAKAYVEKLTPSLLARAFRGQLVPQDPNDEPASVLLERINREKAARTDDRSKIMESQRRSHLAKASR